MTELVDAKMVSELSRIFTLAPERIVWGNLFTAKLYWIKHINDFKGVAELPYMAFYRVPRFHPSYRKQEKTQIVDHDGVSKDVKFLPVMLNYVVEILSLTVREQNQYFKDYMMWSTSESAIGFDDLNGINWEFRTIAEDPEDNSDLEAEEDQGRVIRSTFNIQVESILLESTGISGPIMDILARIHGYYDDIDESFEIATIDING